MRRKYETEIKLKVSNPESVKRRLAALGFCVLKRRYFESNYLFDFPNRKLRKAGGLLRLRFVPAGALLTFKGPPLRSRDYKVRNEYETEVADGKTLWRVLEGLGLRETFRYEKYRTVFGRKSHGNWAALANPASGELVYDETPIGNYLELEGPKGWIDAVAAGLGFRRQDYVTASYVRLYYQRCAELRKKPANMMFRKRGVRR
jgi:adenylate cyclase class 2